MEKDFKTKIESAKNMAELIAMNPYYELRKLNPINGERENALALIMQICYKFGRSNQVH